MPNSTWKPTIIDISHPAMDWSVRKWLWTSKQKMDHAVEEVTKETKKLRWCDDCQAMSEVFTALVWHRTSGFPNGTKSVCSLHLEDHHQIICMDGPWDCPPYDEGCMACHASAPECFYARTRRKDMQIQAERIHRRCDANRRANPD